MKGKVNQGVSGVNVKVLRSGYGLDGIYYAAGNIRGTMRPGDYVYGNLNTTVPPTDIMNFTHFYRADGSKFELPIECKASVSNSGVPTMTLTNEAEPGTPPPPQPNGEFTVTMVFKDGDKVLTPLRIDENGNIILG